MKKTYCITGVSGYIGSLLAQKLSDNINNRVIGLDINLPSNSKNILFHKFDIRDPELSDLLKGKNVDVLIHLAFFTKPEGQHALAKSINLKGTKNILDAAEKSGVKRLVIASSAAAYGSHPENPIPMNESHPLRANKFFDYSYHKAAQERMTQEFIQRNPKTKVIILRPSVLIGPHINNPTGDSLKEKFLIFVRGKEIPIQLIYEDDAVEAFYLAATSESEGVFNVAAPNLITYPEIAKIMNKTLFLLPFWLLAILATIGRYLRLSPAGWRTIKFIRNPIIIDSTKFYKAFQFKPRYDTKEAFMQFYQSIKK